MKAKLMSETVEQTNNNTCRVSELYNINLNKVVAKLPKDNV